MGELFGERKDQSKNKVPILEMLGFEKKRQKKMDEYNSEFDNTLLLMGDESE